MSSNEEMQLCSKCNGTGFRVRREYTPGHNLETKETIDACDFCEGSGRVVMITEVSFRPYPGPEHD